MDAVNQSNVNAFWVACRFGHGEVMRRLACAGIDVMTCDNNGVNCMHLAVLRDHGHILQMLLDSGFPLDLTTNDGFTAIHLAARYRRKEIMDIFLAHLDKDLRLKKKIVNMKCKKTNSPALSIAIANDCDDIAIQLIENDAKIFISDNAETRIASPIFEAIIHRKLEIL